MTGDRQYHHEFGMKAGHAPIADKVVCVDFDGTMFPWGPLLNYEAEPLPGTVSAIRAFVDKGWKVVLFTSRMSPTWLEDAGESREVHIDYITGLCARYGIPFDYITGEKIPAQAYIDDKAIEFTGSNWPEIQERVLSL